MAFTKKMSFFSKIFLLCVQVSSHFSIKTIIIFIGYTMLISSLSIMNQLNTSQDNTILKERLIDSHEFDHRSRNTAENVDAYSKYS